MPTTTASKPSRRKELRLQAKGLGIDGWETMTTDELEEAVSAVEKPSTNGHRPARAAKRNKVTVTKKPRGQTSHDKEEATAPAKRVAKKVAAPVSKRAPQATPRAREVAENGNPFRRGSNLYLLAEELIKGGRRRAMIDRLAKKIELHPWAKKSKDLDVTYEMDKRLLLTKNLLEREFGFSFEVAGRGPENGSIKAIPPTRKTAKKAVAKKR